MPEHLRTVVDAYEKIVPTVIVWKKGLTRPGGPHRRLREMIVPISIGEDECRLFGSIIRAFQPEHCFIIGNAFGLSSCYIAEAMTHNGGMSVVTLDSQTEGDGDRCAAVARQVAKEMGLSILTNKKGFSPQDIPEAVEQEVHDLVFIDGAHSHPQVVRDFVGVEPYTNGQSILVWHDYPLPGIHQSVEAATKAGFRCLWVPTSCEMVVATRDESIFERLQELFPDGVPNPKPHPFFIAAIVILPRFLRWPLMRFFSVTSRKS